MSEYTEVYRDEYCIVSNHSRTKVAIQTGTSPEEESPSIVEADALIQALIEYRNEQEEDDG